jgi:hypothetical protein
MLKRKQDCEAKNLRITSMKSVSIVEEAQSSVYIADNPILL